MPGLRPSARARSLVGAGALALSLAGCAIHRGAWTREPAPAAAEKPAIRLFLIGDAGWRGRQGPAVAARLAERMKATREQGIGAVLLWLGDNLAPARCDGGVDPRLSAVVAVSREHMAAGGASLATVGEAEWACEGAIEGQLQPAAGPRPWIQPALNYVMRLDGDGQARLVSRCAGEPVACAVEPDDGRGVVDLVVLDTAAWLHPAPEGSAQAAAGEASIAEMVALLAALPPQAPGPERILIAHHPIESAGPHGQGGLWPDAAYFLHHPALQAAVQAGVFAGALGGHDHSVQVSADITPAVQRSSRTWLRYPVFQVVSGASTRPDAGAGVRSWRYFQGLSLAPDDVSNHAGFAEVTIRADAVDVLLHARRSGRWQRAEVTIPRRRPPNAFEGALPGLEPCLSCDTRTPRE